MRGPPYLIGLVLCAVGIAACGDAQPSPSLRASAVSAASDAARVRPIANVQTAAQLLPDHLAGDWELLHSDPMPGPSQFDAWARDLKIAGAVEAAVAVATHAQGNSASITAFAAPGRRLEPGMGNGLAFARRWVAAYACGPARRLTLAGIPVTPIEVYPDTCNSGPRNQYLVVFEDQLVVIEDAHDMTQRSLNAIAFAPIIASILDQAH